jgi:hypothetical protein
MKGPIWKEQPLSGDAQAEWAKRFIREFGQAAYDFLKGISDSFDVIIDAEEASDEST